MDESQKLLSSDSEGLTMNLISDAMPEQLPHIVIVGGGFGGLAAAKALRDTPVRITLIDRSNHHLFQPLLYQVATAVLTPGQVASPIRSILRDQSNVTVIMGEVTGVEEDRKQVLANNADRQGVAVDYDYLILAPGAQHNYFGTMNLKRMRRD
jgi:NADH:ubiquinone reductase (H+-translocating)